MVIYIIFLSFMDHHQSQGQYVGPIFVRTLKGLAQAKIIKKSVILFWLLNMTI